jgi:hypothetical protein
MSPGLVALEAPSPGARQRGGDAMANQDTLANTGLTKVRQYKWLMIGAPGELAYLDKTVLEVDHRYQRPAKNNRVLRLANRWNWLACGVLTIAKRDGRYFVVDGQHRLMAALKRSDITALPCLVFESTEMREEAVAFRDSNKERRPITSFEQWNANLVAGDEATHFANTLINKAGRTAASVASPGTVRCLTLLVNAARNTRDELSRVWPLVSEVCEGAVLHEHVLSSMLYLECYLDNGESLTNKRWRDKVLRLGYKGILDATQRAATFYVKGGPKVWALGLMQQLNKTCRTHTLSIREEK